MEAQQKKYVSNGAGTSNIYSAGPSTVNHSRGTSLPSALPQPRSAPDLHGRARRKAELIRLQQEIRLIKEDYERVETLPPASVVCKEVIESIEHMNDPFLPNSRFPSACDRWIRGPPAPKQKFCC